MCSQLMESQSDVVAVTRPNLPGDGLRRLAARTALRVWPEAERPPSLEELGELVADAAAVIPLGTRVDERFLSVAGRLRVIAVPGAGYNNVDVAAARARGIEVTNTPGVLHETTADLTFALILAARRNLLAAVDSLRSGGWQHSRFDAYLGLDVHGATLGLVGYGQIARAVAKRAMGFGMTVQHALSRSGDDGVSRAVGMDELLRTSDIVSVHVPLTDTTRGLIGKEQLEQLKPTATLVNTARGTVVDEAALLAALDAGELHSAGLDVYAEEPVRNGDHPLIRHPKVVAFPHVGSATAATRARMVDLAVDNILAVLEGGPPVTPVPDPDSEQERGSR